MRHDDLDETYLRYLDEVDRREAKDSFLAFYMRMTGFLPPKHIKVVCRLLQSMEEDKVDRAMIFAPPRHAKSLLASILFPAWIMGRNPGTSLMSVVHTQDYAGKIGRKVRNLLRDPRWPFDEVGLSEDSQAREYWTTPQGGEYNGFGATAGNQHGNPAEWLFNDDLVKGRKIAMSAHMREEIWENYKTDLLSRLQGRRKQLMVFCMTGDTSVLMADGTSKALRDIASGHKIATYDRGSIGVSTVINSANQGADSVFVIRMTSGRIVRANARHPFLVKTEGGEGWRRTDTLRKGDKILSVIGVSGAGSLALMTDATSPQYAEESAATITKEPESQKVGVHHPDQKKGIESAKSNIGMASNQRTTTEHLLNKAAYARFAARAPVNAKGLNPSAPPISASTIATRQGGLEACFATTVTLPSGTLEPRSFSSQPSLTYAVAPDTIAEITLGGTEDVYDIQVDRTENFIANGLVSHNTRWHNDDPAGRILPENFDGRTGWYADRQTGEKWFVLSMPAIAEHENDPVGREKGEWLWPDAFGEKQLGGMQKRGGWMWSALYQQRPSPEEGLMFRAEHFQTYDFRALDRSRLQIYITSDYAVTAEAGATDPDYTVHLIWGVDKDWNIFLLDGWRARTEPNIWVREWIRLCKHWKPLLAGEEQGQIIKSVGPFLRTMMAQEQVFVQRRQLSSSINKEMRAQALLGMAALGRLYLPRRDTVDKHMLLILDAFEAEMLQFPTGKHDDMVDAASLFARLLDQIIAGREPEKKGSPHGDTLDDLWKRHEESERRRNQ